MRKLYKGNNRNKGKGDYFYNFLNFRFDKTTKITTFVSRNLEKSKPNK